MSSSSTQRIPLPTRLTSHSPSLPTETQEALIRHLQSTGAIRDLSHTLSDSLARTGWTDRVKALALELLRNGTCNTMPELLIEVRRRILVPSAANGTSDADNTQSNGVATPTASQNGAANTNGAGNGSIAVAKEWTSGEGGLPDVQIPKAVKEAGWDLVHDKIREVTVDVDDNGEVVQTG